jgi:hypothetical protein
MYLAGVRIDAQISDNGVVGVDHTAQHLELTIGSGTTTVRGIVLDRGKRPFQRAAVVLVPQQSRRENPLLYKRSVSGADGRFTFMNVEPGEYKVFAWQTAPTGRAEENSQFLAKYEQAGKPVSVKPGAAPADLQVDIIVEAP